MNVSQQWNKCLDIIKDNLPAEQFDAWFKPIVALSFTDGNLTLRVPSQFFMEHIEEQYLHLLTMALRRVFGEGVRLLYNCNVVTTGDADEDGSVTMAADNSSTKLQQDLRIRRPKIANPFDQEDELEEIDPQLNFRYTFENYCSSTSNRLAVSIARAIADDMDCKTYNPFFVFGATGVGKTHLLQAIGIKIKENAPRTRVLYLTARTFENQYTSAVRRNRVNDFINFYLTIDVLLLDDIQELIGKTATQNTFFHIFNHLHNHQKQLVMSCDCRPAEMDGMVPRLISRFQWGMTVELEKPDFQLRRDVLSLRARQDGLVIAPEILDYIAENITDNIRELEGVVVSLLAHATMLNQDITMELAQSIIGNAVRVSRSKLTFDNIVETVANHYNIDAKELYGKSRKREISDARQLLMYLAKSHTNMSSTLIGQRLYRTHATVLHACTQVEQRMSIEKAYRAEVEKVSAELKP